MKMCSSFNGIVIYGVACERPGGQSKQMIRKGGPVGLP